MKWSSLNDALKDIKKRPEMYFGGGSVHDLRTFVDGYLFALDVLYIENKTLFDESMSFHDWIALRTHFYESTSGWSNMLDEYYETLEKSFEMFFVHYHEYANRSGRVIKYLEPKEFKEWKYEVVNENKYYSYLTPGKIEIVKYTDDPGMFIRFLDSKNELIGREEYALNNEALGMALLNIPFNDNEWKDA